MNFLLSPKACGFLSVVYFYGGWFSDNQFDGDQSEYVCGDREIMEKLMELSVTIGLNEGEDFKKDTLQYHKIIILTDGAHILHGRRQTTWIP
ncbi:DNA topoisomerase (ATP-hydrolyzing) [Trifolium repens]|nr:DNA topoisomerase (ATP-hydrolyzing) [Trifolium repens]